MVSPWLHVPLWVCVHVCAWQLMSDRGYKWENVAYVCLSPQLFNLIFIRRGQTLTRHTNTPHPPTPHPSHKATGSRDPIRPFLLQHTSGWSYCPLLYPADMHNFYPTTCWKWKLCLAASSGWHGFCDTDSVTFDPCTTAVPCWIEFLFPAWNFHVLTSMNPVSL